MQQLCFQGGGERETVSLSEKHQREKGGREGPECRGGGSFKDSSLPPPPRRDIYRKTSRCHEVAVDDQGKGSVFQAEGMAGAKALGQDHA